MKVHRGKCSLSNKDLAALDAASWERFKRHVDFENMANELRDQRDQVDELSRCFWAIWPRLTPSERDWLTEKIGPPPIHNITPIGVTLRGKFIEQVGG